MSYLIETLKSALNIALSECTQDDDFENALSLLSDRSALLWSLLEEEAAEVVEEYRYVELDPEERGTGFSVNGEGFVVIPDEVERIELVDHSCEVDKIEKLILCLARAIQEQKHREVSGG